MSGPGNIIASLSTAVATKLPPSLLLIVILFMAHDFLLFYAMHDLQFERIRALVEIFQKCTDALKLQTG